MAYRNENQVNSVPSSYPTTREVAGNASSVERTMQVSERALLVDTTSGNTTVVLPDLPCVPEGTEIYIRAQGGGQVTVEPIAGQSINGIQDGSSTHGPNAGDRFVRIGSSWYN